MLQAFELVLTFFGACQGEINIKGALYYPVCSGIQNTGASSVAFTLFQFIYPCLVLVEHL